MLRDVNRRAAIFPAERDALEDAKDDEQGRPGRSRLGVGRQEADQKGRSPHQADREEERALAAELVAYNAENQSAKRAEGEAGGEQRERGEQCRGRVEARKEDL